MARCDNCGFEPVKVWESSESFETGRKNMLCEICRSTHLSKAEMYPSQCKDPDLARAIGWIGNYLARLVKESK